MGDSFKGIVAGLFSGIVWAFFVATGVAVIASVYRDQLVADVQPRIPPPQPILPDFPQLGYTTPPTADQLIQTAVGMAVSYIFFLGVIVGPILGLVFSSLEKSFPRTFNIIVKGIIFAVVADLLYALVVFPQQSNPLGFQVQLYSWAFSFLAAAMAGLVLGFLYRRLGGGVIVQHQLTEYEPGQRIQPS
jgi:uncharacterized membrane protein YagU involved in acid resistance